MKHGSFAFMRVAQLIVTTTCSISISLPLLAATWSTQDIGLANEVSRLYLDNSGRIAGTYEQPDGHLASFVTDSSGQNRFYFSPLTAGGETSALGINNYGAVLVVSGSVMTNSSTRHAFALGKVTGGALVQVHDADDITDHNAWLSIPLARYSVINGIRQQVAITAMVGGLAPSNGFGNSLGFFDTQVLPSTILEVLAMNSSSNFVVRTAKGFYTSDASGKTKLAIPKKLLDSTRGLDVVSFDDQGRLYGAQKSLTSSDSKVFVWESKVSKKPTQYFPAYLNASGTATYGNSSGQIIGHADVNGESRAFITGPNMNGMRDLSGDVTLPDGGSITHAWAINDKGQVAAYDSNSKKAYLLTPTQSSCAVTYTLVDEDDTSFTADVNISNNGGGEAKGVFAQVAYKFSPKLIDVSFGTGIVKSGAILLAPTTQTDAIAAGDTYGFTFTGTKKKGAMPAPTNITATLGGETCRVSIL